LGELLEIQRKGALANALGRPLFDNPFYKSEALPTATGEPILMWEAKCDAWELGWRINEMSASKEPIG